MVDSAPAIQGLGKSTWVLACGMGMHFAWVACLFYQGALFDAVGNAAIGNDYYLASMAALTITLLVFGLTKGGPQQTGFFSNRACALVFALIACVGSLMVICVVGADTGVHRAIFVTSAILTGIGSAYINIVWGCLLVGHRETQAMVVLCLAYALSSVLYYVISHLPAVLFVVLLALLPVASIAIALGPATRGIGELSEAKERPTDEYAAHDLRLFVYRAMGAALLFGMVVGVVRELANVVASADGNALGHSALFLLFAGIPLVVAIVYLVSPRLQSSPAERSALVYRVAVLAMIGSLLVSVVRATAGDVLGVILLAGYTFFKIFVWSELCEIGRAGGATPVRLFALGEASMSFALLVGVMVLRGFLLVVPAPEDAARALIALSIAALLVAYLFIFTERQIIALEEINKAKEEGAQRFRFQERLDELSRRFGLTKRESEVLRLFVRGRSTSRIAEDLYVSSGTVSTHLRNIYHKADVHSRQELLDLLDAKDDERAKESQTA